MTNIKLLLIGACIVLFLTFFGFCAAVICEKFMDDSYRCGVRNSENDK